MSMTVDDVKISVHYICFFLSCTLLEINDIVFLLDDSGSLLLITALLLTMENLRALMGFKIMLIKCKLFIPIVFKNMFENFMI